MNIVHETIGPVAVLQLTGSFDRSSAPAIATWLQRLAAPDTDIVLDMVGVASIDSAALVTLVRGLDRCQKQGGMLHLCNVRHSILMVLELTRLTTSFSFFVDLDHALGALGALETRAVGW